MSSLGGNQWQNYLYQSTSLNIARINHKFDDHMVLTRYKFMNMLIAYLNRNPRKTFNDFIKRIVTAYDPKMRCCTWVAVDGFIFLLLITIGDDK